MATGGGFRRLKQSKSETKQRSNWQRSVSSEKDDALSLTSFPSDIRINNWDLSDLRSSASADSRRRKKSKGNPEREREQSLSMDSPPHGEPKQRTPTSLSRTRNTPVSQRDALEKLKQKLTYSDDYSTDGEPNNERAFARGRRRLVNNSQREGPVTSNRPRREARSNRNNNTEAGPDSNQIVERLMQIRDYIKQASAMMETLQKSGDSGNAEDLAKVGRLIANLREQEQGYMGLLQTNIALRNESAENANDGIPTQDGTAKPDSNSDNSVDLEVESDASEATENTTSSRPRIEDKLGLDSEEEEESESNSKDEDTALDNTMVATSSAQALAARSVSDTLNHLTQEREDPVGATGVSDVLSAQQRHQLMKIMMEKQEQLRMLQSRQEELLSKKREAEKRLQQAQDRDNQARAALAAVEAGRAVLEEEGAFLDQLDVPLKSNIVGYPVSDDDEASNAREMDTLAELQHQLNYLRNEFSSARPETGTRKNRESSTIVSGASVTNGMGLEAAVGQQEQQLKDKLQDLQQKKQKMDQLLHQLQTLRSHRLQVLNNETNTGSSQRQPPPVSQHSQLAVHTQSHQLTTHAQPHQLTTHAQPHQQATHADLSSLLTTVPMTTGASSGSSGVGSGSSRSRVVVAADIANAIEAELGDFVADHSSTLSMFEAQEKLQKLQEVRERLNQLRDLVQYYQKIKTEPMQESTEQDDFQALTTQRPQNTSQNAGESSTGCVGGSNAIDPMLLRITQLQSMPLLAPSEEQSDEENASALESEDQESEIAPWDRDPEVQEKIRKLMKAKDKLRNLQGLISEIEELPDSEKVEETVKKNSGSSRPKTRAPRGAEQESLAGGVASMLVSEGERAPDLTSDTEGMTGVDGQLQDQMEELSRLRGERERLLLLQNQLKALHDQFQDVEQDAETEACVDTSLQKEPEEQPPNTSVVTFASNDELYSKMRDQRIEREELRSKKKELEAIMKKDQNRRHYSRNQDNQSDTVSYTTGTDAFGANASVDATMATWGGSTVDNLENITEDEDGQDGAGPANDEDDGYPSDGIVQVEEEEEENDTDNGTYTIDADARQRRQARFLGSRQGQGARPKTSRGRRGYPQPIKPESKKKSKMPQSQPWGRRAKEERTRSGPLQGVEDTSSVEESFGEASGEQFRQQLEKMATLCQSMMQGKTSSPVGRQQQQQQPHQQLTASSIGSSKVLAKLLKLFSTLPTNPVTAGSISPTAGDVQTQLIKDMQQQQLMLAVSQCNQQLLMQQFDMQALHRQLQQVMSQMAILQQQSTSALLSSTVTPDPLAPPAHFGTHPSVISASYPSLSPLTSTLAAQVPNNVATSVNVQSSRQTTFTVNNPSFPGSFPYARAQLPVSQSAQTNGLDAFQEAANAGSGLDNKLPEENYQGGDNSTEEYEVSQPLQLWEGSEEPGNERKAFQHERAQHRINLQAYLRSRRKKSARKQSSEKVPPTQSDWQISSQREKSGNYKSGLSAGINGTGFTGQATMQDTVDSQIEGATARSVLPERAGFGELNLFEELRETIYTEVATLISQNESRPHFLITLFRELQNLTSDLMRQRAIFAVQEIIQSTLSGKDDDVDGANSWQPWKTEQDSANCEMTPSESCPTSEDDSVKARVQQHATAVEHKKQRGRSYIRGSSLKNDKFDYTEPAITTSSLSTPTNNANESPFSHDSLGDTVIHLDKALAKMRLEMQQAEQERAEHLRDVMDRRPELSPDGGTGDQGSESSVSDMPYPRIDARELDQQIKGVMRQVIPVIKDHINDVCSPQFLAYIQRLVLSLVRQPGQTHEFSRFFYGQLASILQDTLAKYEGRRVRECGEDLLLDMSEVLFNELAFLRIMKDLDDPAAVEKMKTKSWFTQSSSSKSMPADMVGEDYDAAGNESDNEASDDEDKDMTPQNQKNGIDEEEELGKDRDDELARKLVTQGGDEKDDDTDDLFATSEFHIQLAMSETKPFTRIGSDEDTDGSDESLSLEDPSDTAVSRDAMMEHKQGCTSPQLTSTTSTSTTNAIITTTVTFPILSSTTHIIEKRGDALDNGGILESRGMADGSLGDGSNPGILAAFTDNSNTVPASCDGSSAAAEGGSGDGGAVEMKVDGTVQVNGEVLSEGEMPVVIDDLPSVLLVDDPELLEQKCKDEEDSSTILKSIINSTSGQEELAGDGAALKEPGSTPV